MVDNDALSFEAEAMRALGYRVVDHLVDRWAGLSRAPIPPAPPRASLRARLGVPPPRAPRPAEHVIDEAVSEVLRHAAPTGHPRFFGFIPSPSSFVGVLADALVAGFNPFGGNFMEAPGPHELERATVHWMRRACGLPEAASGSFVSGGSMANLTALCAARDSRGRGRVYISDQTHSSVAKGLRVLGLDDVVTLPSDAGYALRLDALDVALAADAAQGRAVLAIVATAGTTNTGAIDPLPAIADRCAARGIWMHVDGAYGAAARFGSREPLEGLERADSISLDPHKWLFTPYECGCVLVRDGAQLARSFATHPDYLVEVSSGEPDLQDEGLQLTRSLRALKVWMTFQVFGADAIGAAIDSGIERGERFGERLRSRGGWRLAAPPSLGICAFRRTRLDDEANAELARRLVATTEAMFSTTVLDGRRHLRGCFINPRTSDDDLERTLDRLEALAAEL